jgi:hypothetical protein
LWDQLEACEGVDCLIWQQELQGHKATHLGAVHGFAGNALPALRGRHLLPENEQKQWLDCIDRTLRATGRIQPVVATRALSCSKELVE